MSDHKSNSALTRIWQRIPLAIRAILTGLFVFAIVGNLARLVILMFMPAPWSFIIMLVVLWLYMKYFSGSWPPASTAAARRENFRSMKLSPSVWGWSLVAALAVVVVLQAGLVVTFRLVAFPVEEWNSGIDLSAVPPWMAWALVVIASLTAGITEEAGFRGYMQVPLEKRYGPAAGIAIVSIMFMVLHLNQAWAPPVLILLILIGAMWGIMAYTSGSLLPAMISHSVADIFNFSYWWTDLAGRFDQRPIGETGMDSHFIVWAIIFGASIALFVWAARKTLVVREDRQMKGLTV
jgi:membrane protease YdiL (CAAX protease family)